VSLDSVVVRKAKPDDCDQLAVLRHSLWPDSDVDHHRSELVQLLAGTFAMTLPYTTLVAHDAHGRIVGFVEVDLRSQADGCDPRRPVGYLEGWYVVPEWRRKQVGAALVAAAEAWARSQGCTEMASDTWQDNVDSQRAHEALGFEVVDRCVNYRKVL
jgi:aminoglycoside 6'-N-acetyltransferase I